jgi:hypothetical protein
MLFAIAGWQAYTTTPIFFHWDGVSWNFCFFWTNQLMLILPISASV